MNRKNFLIEAALIAAMIVGVMLWRSFQGKEETGPKDPVAIIPVPEVLEERAGSFVFDDRCRIAQRGDLGALSGYLKQALEARNISIPEVRSINNSEVIPQSIMLQLVDGGSLTGEAYQLEVFPDGIDIVAGTERGLFYGIQSLLQLIDVDDNAEIPGVFIQDEPAYAWRGLMLDACRQTHSMETVKRYIDLLAYHKMNTLHWHLTEDQGWRIQIDSWPKLTEVGAFRTQPDGSRYGSFFSKDQIREVVEYASARQITVVPEIEMPGHSQAALAAYPELSCTGGPHEVWNDWGVSKEIYCAGNERSFEFIFDVLSEVVELFPGPYIHLGGDEAPVTRWESCSKCQRRMQQLGLDDEHDMQPWFMNRVADSLSAMGKTVIGWDEILHPDLQEDAIVQAWRSMDKVTEAVAAGHRVIASPTSHAYFDYGVETTDLEKVYSFNPGAYNPDGLIGGSCNLWSEHIPEPALDQKAFPRAVAMAEVLWSGSGARDYEGFHADLQIHYSRLEKLGVNYGYEKTPVAFASTAAPEGYLDLAFEPGQQDLRIFFGLGEFEPDTNDVEFIEPNHLALFDGDQTLSARAFRFGKAWGPAYTRTFRIGAATGKKVSLKEDFHPNYTGGGSNALTDGRAGTTAFRDGIWQGFFGKNLDATIDLGAETALDTVSCSFLQYNNAWIFAPRSLTVYGGASIESMQQLGSTRSSVAPKQRGQFISELKVVFEEQEVRYLRVVVENLGKCPPWHEAAGADAWIFADEIVAR